jgi:NitT/TauT family transport system substrate-binding protein
MHAPLSPRKPDFDRVRDLMIESGLLEPKIEFDDYVDVWFTERAHGAIAWRFEPSSEVRQ